MFGNVVRIMTHCQISFAAAETWDTQQPLNDYCSLELQFWDLNLKKKINQKNCFQQPINSKIVHSDASSFACGALIHNEDRMLCHKMFNLQRKK